MSNDKSEILIEDLPPTVQESLRAELAALYKELHATNQRLQESVNQHLSPALIPTLVQIRAEGIDDVTQSLPDATWLLIRFNGGVEDLSDCLEPGDYTIATSDPDEPSKLIAYSLRKRLRRCR